ncbi:MAG: CapA family protein [Enhygromyxa sp.]
MTSASRLCLAGLLLPLGCPKPAPVEAGAQEPRGPVELAQTTLDQLDAPKPEPEPEPEAEPEPPWSLPEDYLKFDGACTPGKRITIGFGGDLLLHHELQKQAYAAKQGAGVLWEGIADLLAEPDLTYLNFEGVLAPGLDRDFLEVADPGKTYDRVVYTGYPRFNSHPSIAQDLVAAGVDVVSTANNHSLDRGPIGVDRTIASLRKAKLAFFGTREQTGPERWYTITEVEGVKIAWVACTKHTNRVPDDFNQVLRCGNGATVEQTIAQLRATGRYQKRKPKVDAVIVTPHWGKEYTHEVGEKQRELARKWIEAGALAVVGSHPHVVQPWERLVSEDGREGFVLYSLGNFASHQPELPRRSSLLVYLSLAVGEDGAVQIAGVRHLPLHVRQSGKEFFVEAIDRVAGPADARALILALLGSANLVHPDEDKRGDPHCDERWRPHPIPEWAELPEPFVLSWAEGEGELEPGGEPGPG